MLVAEEAVEIQVLRRQGKSIREIARMLDLSRNTVRRYLRREGLPRYEREARPSMLDVQAVPRRGSEGGWAGLDSGDGAVALVEGA
jgi:transposase